MKTVDIKSDGATIEVKVPQGKKHMVKTIDVAPNKLGPFDVVKQATVKDDKGNDVPVYTLALSETHVKAGWELA